MRSAQVHGIQHTGFPIFLVLKHHVQGKLTELVPKKGMISDSRLEAKCLDAPGSWQRSCPAREHLSRAQAVAQHTFLGCFLVPS